MSLHSVLHPLSSSWIISIIWLYIGLNRTPNIDCYWVYGPTLRSFDHRRDQDCPRPSAPDQDQWLILTLNPEPQILESMWHCRSSRV